MRLLSRTVGLCAVSLTTLNVVPCAAQPDEPTLFVCTYPNLTQGRISSMRIEADGSLTLIDVAEGSDTGASAVALAPDGRHIALSHGTADDIERLDIFTVNSDGTLTFLLTQLVPDSPLDMEWLSPTVLAVTEAEFGGSNFLTTYRLDPAAPSLTQIDEYSTGLFLSDTARHPHGDYIVANDSLSNGLYVYEVNLDGTLALADQISTGSTYPLGPGWTRQGDRLYATGGISSGREAIIGFSFDPLVGMLDPLPGSPWVSPGESPKLAVSSSDDRVLLVGHGTDATVRTFLIDPDTGGLTSTGYTFDVGLQGTLGEVAVLDDLVFITDNSTATDGKAGVYSFRLDSETGVLTMIGSDLYDTGTTSPNRMAVWTPARSIWLEASEIVRGDSADLSVTGATPGEPVGLAASVSGPGYIPLAGLGVVLGLDRPQQVGPTRTASATGEASWTLPVPDNLPAQQIWVQAVQPGRTSGVVHRIVR